MAQAILLKESQYLQKVEREKRTRKHTAWIIHDLKSNALLLSQKLDHLVNYINHRLATVQREKTTLAGLYEAADTADNRVDGFHKMRYKVLSCPLSDCHSMFNQIRNSKGVDTAIILTSSPQAYVFGSY